MNLKNPESGKKEEDLNVLSNSVNPVRLKNNPVEITNQDAAELYRIILD